jgi:hypothetical protein
MRKLLIGLVAISLFVSTPIQAGVVEVKKIVHIDSLQARLSEAEAKVERLTKENEKIWDETRKAAEVLEDVKEKAALFVAENKASTYGQYRTSEVVIKYNKEVRKHNEKMVNAVKDCTSKLFQALNSSIKLNHALIEAAVLKGSDEETIEGLLQEALNLRETISKAKKKKLQELEVCRKFMAQALF